MTISPSSARVAVRDGDDIAYIADGTVDIEGLWSETVGCSRGLRSARVCEVEGGVIFGKTGRGGFVTLEGTVRNAVAGGYVITAGVLDGDLIDENLRVTASVALRRPFTNIAMFRGGRLNENFFIGRVISPAVRVIVTSQSFLEVFPAAGVTVTAKCFWRGEKFDILTKFMPEWRDSADCELEGGSAVTDASGVATFDKLLVRSSNTNLVQVAFFAGGLTTSLTATKFPYPFSTEVQGVELVQLQPPTAQTSSPSLSPLLALKEGHAGVLSTYYAARVTGVGGVPLAGRRVKAEISFADGAPTVSAALYRSTAYDRSRKELIYAESLPSDEQGIARFSSDLAFSRSGAAGPFRIRLNGDGFESASSPVITVQSSVTRLVASWTPRNGTMAVGVPDIVDAAVTVFGDNDLPLAGKSVFVSSLDGVVGLWSPSSTAAVTDTQGRVIIRGITVVSLNSTKAVTEFKVFFTCEGLSSAPSSTVTLVTSASAAPTCTMQFLSAPTVCRVGSAGCSGGNFEVVVTGTFGEPLPGVLVRITHSPVIVSPVYFVGPGGTNNEVFAFTDSRGRGALAGITMIAGVNGLLALSAEAYLNATAGSTATCTVPFKALAFDNPIAHVGIRSFLKNGKPVFPISGDLVGAPILSDSAAPGDRYDLTLSLLMADRTTPVPASAIVADPALLAITAPVFVELTDDFLQLFGSFVSPTFPISGLTSAVFNASAGTASYSVVVAQGCPPFSIVVGSRLMGYPGTALLLTVASPVRRLELVSAPAVGSTLADKAPGVPFATQPAVRVLDKDGNPLQGVRITATAETSSDQAFVANLANTVPGDGIVSTALSRPSGVDGIARWSSLGFFGAFPSAIGYTIRFDTIPPSNATFARSAVPVPVGALARMVLVVSDWGDLVVPSGGTLVRAPRMYAVGINGRVKTFAVVAVVTPFSPFDTVPGFDPYTSDAAFNEKLDVIRDVLVKGDIAIVVDGSDAVFSDLRITGPPGLYSLQFVGPGLKSSADLTASTLSGTGNRYGAIIRLTSDPSTIFFTSNPPTVLALGGTVMVTAKVVVSTGGGLPDVKVTLEAIPSPGTVSPRDVVLLDPETSTAVTDASGVATFQTKFTSGPSGFYTFKAVAQSAESEPSTLMQLFNPVDRVTVLVQPTLGNHSILVDDSERGLYAKGEPRAVTDARKRRAESEAKRANASSTSAQDLVAIPVIQPVVLVRGPDGLPVQDVIVEPVITNQGILRYTTTLTNASGVAAFTDLRVTAGKSGGGYEIYFVAQGLSSSPKPSEGAEPFYLKNARDPDPSDLKNWQLIAFASIVGVMPFWFGVTMSRKSSPLFLVLSWGVSAIYVWFSIGFLPEPDVTIDKLVLAMRIALIIAAVVLSALACLDTALTLLPARFLTQGFMARAARVSAAPPALLRKGNDAIKALRSDHHQRFVKPAGPHLAHVSLLLRGKQAFERELAVNPVLDSVREASEKEMAKYDRWIAVADEYKSTWLLGHPPLKARFLFWVKTRLYKRSAPGGVVASVLDASAPSHFPLRLLFGLSLTVIGLFLCCLFSVMVVQYAIYGVRLAQYQLFTLQSTAQALAPTTAGITELEQSIAAMASAVSLAHAALASEGNARVAAVLDSAYADLRSRFGKLTVSDEISLSARLAKEDLAGVNVESLMRVTTFINGALNKLTSDELVVLLDQLYHDLGVTGYAAIALTLAFIVASILPLAMRYPSISCKLRRGDRSWAREGYLLPPEGRLDLASRLPGFMLWGNVFAFAIFFFVIWLLLFVLTFNSLRSRIVKAVWPFVLTLLSTSFLGSIVLPLVIRFLLTNGKTVVTHPSVFSLADTFMVIISIITGISGNISRFFTTIFTFLITFNRIDLRQGELDRGFNIFYSVAEAQHTNNNCIVIVAVDLLSQHVGGTRVDDSSAEEVDLGRKRPASRRAALRWCVAYTLVRNPTLLQLRKSALPKLVEKEMGPDEEKKKKGGLLV